MTASLSRPEGKTDVDAIVETIIYLYTESRRLTKEMAGSFGLTGPQLTILKLLESFPDLSLSTLSERIRAQNSTVTGIVDRMEREGLVRRERSRSDRRVVLLRLSDKGGRLARDIQVEPMEIFRQALSELSTNDLQDLLRILVKLQRGVLQRVSRSGSKQEPARSDSQPAAESSPGSTAAPEDRVSSDPGDRGAPRKARRSKEGIE